MGSAIVLAACQSHESAAPEEAPAVKALYVASAADGDDRISIAVVVDGDRLTGYACGDDPSHDDYTGWFYGKLGPDGHFRLAHRGSTLEGSVTDGAMTGTLAETDRRLTWTGARATGRDLTGLYVVQDSGCETGVIVIDNGQKTPLVRGAWCDDTGLELPVTPIVPLELIDEHLAVRIMNVTAPRQLLTMPVIDRAGRLQVTDL